MVIHATRLPLALVLLTLAGCGDAGEDAPGADAPAVEAEAPAEAGRNELGDGPGTTPGVLVPVNRSGVRGTAELVRDGDDYVVTLDVSGLDEGIRYSAHVHEGECVGGGPIRLPLGRILAQAEGTGSSRMRVTADRLPTDTRLFVQMLGPDDRPIACANLPSEADPS